MTSTVAIGLVGTVLAVCGWRVRKRYFVVTVRGTSMTPTFADGERLLATRRHRLSVGDVVVFRGRRGEFGPGELLVKRVAAVAGDEMPPDLAAPGERGPVAAGCFAVRGDAAQSLDSRHFGPVPLAALEGICLRRLR